MNNTADRMRQLINLLENAPPAMDPGLARYIQDNPDDVSASQEEAMAKLRQMYYETSSRFDWGIARLPDGRFISSFPKALQRWGLKIISHGTSEDL